MFSWGARFDARAPPDKRAPGGTDSLYVSRRREQSPMEKQLPDKAPLYGEDDPIASPAYGPFKTAGLLTMAYKIHNTDQIDTVPGDATVLGNSMIKALATASLACWFAGRACSPSWSKSLRSRVAASSRSPTVVAALAAGLHRVVDPALQLQGGVRRLTEDIIQNGNL